MARIAAFFTNKVDVNHHAECQHQTGDQTTDQQLADRNTGRNRVHDYGDTGRDDRADDGGSARNGNGKLIVVAVIAHGLDFNCAQAAGIGNRSAGHTGEDNGRQHVGMAQAAGDPAHGLFAEAEDLVGDAAVVHDVAR